MTISISTGGTIGTFPPDFGQGDAYTNAPPPTIGRVKYLHYTVYSLSFPEKIARNASSIAFYKISVPEIT